MNVTNDLIERLRKINKGSEITLSGSDIELILKRIDYLSKQLHIATFREDMGR